MIRNRISLTVAGLLTALTFSSPTHAEPGRLLAAQCAQCHGTNGAGPGFDNIAGKSASEMFHELREMKYRTQIESIMDRQARGYTDDQLLLISTFLSTQAAGADD